MNNPRTPKEVTQLVRLMVFWGATSRGRTDNAILRNLKYSVLHFEMKLGVTPNGIPKVDLAMAILLLRHPSGGVRAWTENDFKDY